MNDPRESIKERRELIYRVAGINRQNILKSSFCKSVERSSCVAKSIIKATGFCSQILADVSFTKRITRIATMTKTHVMPTHIRRSDWYNNDLIIDPIENPIGDWHDDEIWYDDEYWIEGGTA